MTTLLQLNENGEMKTVNPNNEIISVYSAEYKRMPEKTFTQTSHGFVVGNIITFSNLTNEFILAEATTIENADVVGIVTRVIDDDNFALGTDKGGYFNEMSGLITGNIYYLSSSPGGYTNSKPTAAGNIRKILFKALSTTEILWYNGHTEIVPSAASSISALDDIPDVDISGAVDGQVLTFNSTSGNWEAGSGGSGASSLAGLTDVNINTPLTINEVLLWNGTDKFENTSLTANLISIADTNEKFASTNVEDALFELKVDLDSLSLSSLDDINETSLSSASEGDILQLVGSKWTAVAPTLPVSTMMKGTYDTDDSGVVDAAESLVQGSDIVNASEIKTHIDTGSIHFKIMGDIDTGPSVDGFVGGDGTLSDPYLIATPEAFLRISNMPDKYYKQIVNLDFSEIDFSDLNGYDPTISDFSGVYDGDGFAIYNITKSIDGYIDCGVFGKISGTVKNLRVENISINGDSSIDDANVGLFAGMITGTVESCSAEGTITTNGNETNVGGFTGYLSSNGSITDSCVLYASRITGTLATIDYIGGFVGKIDGSASIERSHSLAILADISNIGGFVGLYAAGGFTDCIFDTTTATITREDSSNTNISGITGLINSDLAYNETTPTNSNYVNYDFDNVWQFDPNIYPGGYYPIPRDPTVEEKQNTVYRIKRDMQLSLETTPTGSFVYENSYIIFHNGSWRLLSGPALAALNIPVDTSSFSNVLSSTDDKIQTALNTLDDHGHATSEIAGLDDSLNASSSHIADASVHRVIDDITASNISLYSSNKIISLLSGKADSSHNHTASNITDWDVQFGSTMAGTYIKDLVVDPQKLWSSTKINTELGNKANVGHTHDISQITLLQNELDDASTHRSNYSNPHQLTASQLESTDFNNTVLGTQTITDINNSLSDINNILADTGDGSLYLSDNGTYSSPIISAGNVTVEEDALGDGPTNVEDALGTLADFIRLGTTMEIDAIDDHTTLGWGASEHGFKVVTTNASGTATNADDETVNIAEDDILLWMWDDTGSSGSWYLLLAASDVPALQSMMLYTTKLLLWVKPMNQLACWDNTNNEWQLIKSANKPNTVKVVLGAATTAFNDRTIDSATDGWDNGVTISANGSNWDVSISYPNLEAGTFATLSGVAEEGTNTYSFGTFADINGISVVNDYANNIIKLENVPDGFTNNNKVVFLLNVTYA